MFSDISEVLAASIIKSMMIEAAKTSETSVKFYQTTGLNIAGDSHLHTCCHENLKSHRHCHCSVLYTKYVLKEIHIRI
jgi:hypothetical protein